jgi:hypothetical protein
MKNMHRLLVLAAALLLGPSFDARAQGCTVLSTLPATISAPGSYCVQQDLSYSSLSGTAITVTSGHVVLDLGGHTIWGSANPASTATGIYGSDLAHITIRNGKLSGFHRGIQLEGNIYSSASNGHLIEGVELIYSFYFGIRVVGIECTVRNNRLTPVGGTTAKGTNTDVFGIEVFGSQNVISGNEVLGMVPVGTGVGYAIFMNASSYTIVEGNRVIGGPGSSAIWAGSSLGVMVVNNRINYGSKGVTYSASTGSYRDNLTVGVTYPYSGGTDAGNNQ